MSVEFMLLIAAGVVGYYLTRNFVRRRLRFVDAAQSIFAPLVAGVLATALVLPLALLPAVSAWTAVCFGLGAMFGASSARHALRREDGELRRLAP